MIEQMVAGLDERLRQAPDDPEGWKRLVRSYMVLGRTEQARDALERGAAALGTGTRAAADLLDFAGSLGLAPQDETP
jgi:cytochrome c-type biogenesis protein CcmH